ncbi:hypothetical protein SUGI_0702850 [Cryptomeria japonica]|nr:hypothetical protein SUGI_0702850 [Cryptomeria japonica]
MSNVEASISSSTRNFSEIGNGFEASTSSSTKVGDSNASARLSIDLALAYIDDVLSSITNKKFITKSLSSEAHAMAVDVLKGVGNAHWPAVGLLAVANVLERLDKISSNDRECIDLLRGMLDLAKYIKMVRDIDADFHREILKKMSESLHLMVSGAILCHSFIRCSRITKYVKFYKLVFISSYAVCIYQRVE